MELGAKMLLERVLVDEVSSLIFVNVQLIL